MPPFSSPPNCTMHRPLTTIGEHEVKNRGNVSSESVLRQRTFPVAASRHERVPRTPSVTTLPSATVGELRGPGNREAAPEAALAAYLSDHCSLPVLASRQAMTSSPSRRGETEGPSPTGRGGG